MIDPEEHRKVEKALRAAALQRGATVEVRGYGHFQIKGLMLCNYYPFSKRRSAYLAATTRAFNHVSIDGAVAMAFELPPVATVDRRDQRSNPKRYQRFKRRMWNAGVRTCRWCREPLDTTDPKSPLFWTVDHEVPLHRGGLDNPNNWRLAHDRCNRARGNHMPELGPQRGKS